MRDQFGSILLLISCVLLLALHASAISPITIYGSKLFDNAGNQFYIKGVAYQYGLDPLTDPEQCQRDADILKNLGANTIRVYAVDRTQPHDNCMTVFAVAGIYVIVDLTTPTESISRTSPTWNLDLYNAYTQTFAAFAKYDNLLGVFVGNEVVSQANNTIAAPFVKAAARDVKAFRDASGYRNIPVGYATGDIAQLRAQLFDYMACGSDPDNAVDFYGFNVYSWCGFSTFQTSGYDVLNQTVANTPIPVFLAETGCSEGGTRNFGDQAELLGPDMSTTWSGSIVYEYFEGENNYGLVSYQNNVSGSDPDSAPSGKPQIISPAFGFLQERWATLSPSTTAAADYTPKLTAPACPSSTASTWLVDAAQPLPTISGLTISTISKVTTVSSSATFVRATTSRKTGSSSTSAGGSGPGSNPIAPKSHTYIIVIVVVIVVVLAILVPLAFLYLRRRRKAWATAAANAKRFEGSTEIGGAPVSQLDAAGNQITPHREELENTAKPLPPMPPVELPAEPVKFPERPMYG